MGGLTPRADITSSTTRHFILPPPGFLYGPTVAPPTFWTVSRTLRMLLLEREENAGYFTWWLPLNTILKESFEVTPKHPPG